MTDNIKGKPGSLTSTAFNTGIILERRRITNIIRTQAGHSDRRYTCECQLCELLFLINDRNVL